MGQNEWDLKKNYYSVDFMVTEEFEFVLIKSEAECKHQNVGFLSKISPLKGTLQCKK